MIVSHPKLRPTLMSISHNAQRGDRALPNAPFPTHRRLFTHSNAHCRPTATGLCGRRIAPDTNPNALPPHSAITHGVSLAFSGSLINENSSVTPEHLHLTANISKPGIYGLTKLITFTRHTNGGYECGPEIPAYSYLQTVVCKCGRATRNDIAR